MTTDDDRPAPSALLLANGELVCERYEVLRVLGKGGMGVVYRVLDRELDEEIALKILRPELSTDLVSLARFRREVKLARRVTHPNVARTFDVGQHEGLRFLTMELVPGAPVSSLLRGGRKPPLPEALRISGEVARGLSAAHAVGVVHRDLKPDNVMIGPGAVGRVVITDFGIARLSEGLQERHETVGPVGTPAYIAPEQLEGHPVDGRTDVHALGAFMFELLTGALPFRGDTLMTVLVARLQKEAPDPRTIDPTISPELADLINRALARAKEDRPDAETMLQSIERLRGERAIEYAGPTAPPPDRRPPIGTGPLSESEAAANGPTVIAVAPVDADRDLASRADDVAAAMGDGLAKLRGLRVVPPSTVKRVMRKNATNEPIEAPAAAFDLGARWLVESTLRGDAARVRARVRLVDVVDEIQLWASGAIEMAASGTFEVEDRLAREVTAAVRERMTTAGPRQGPSDPEVRAYYERARAAYEGDGHRRIDEAIAILDEAVVRFPGDAWLMSLFGRALLHLYAQQGSRDGALAARGEEMCLRALAADASVAETFASIGLLRLIQGEARAGARAFQSALALDPWLVTAHVALGNLLVDTGRFDEGMHHFDLATRESPASFSAFLGRARTKALLDDRVGAAHEIARARAAGGALGTHQLLVRLVVWWNDKEGAGALAEAMEAHRTGAAWENAIPVMHALARGQYLEGASEVLEMLRSDGQSSPGAACLVVEVATEYLSLMGKHSEALDWLERSDSLPFVNIAWLDRCPALAPIRADPRAAAVRARVAARAAAVWR